MLGLLHPTDPAWVDTVEGELGRLLDDHAHCELKAAQSALSIVGRWGGAHPELVAPLVALAKEEMEHFEAVLAHATAHGVRLNPPAPDDYVLALQAATKREASDVPRLLDRLLVSALIEARSCE
ncbi:MAG: tRNA-(ms[2]io[6]A)-hydroxylase, partial [Myxococcales bacterium]|nr:tRNA-(ms[2]io[6]A)-hydroxylase [Myxococcales bacterium]